MVSIPKFHYKTNTDARVAICVPVRDFVTIMFANSLSNLTYKCGQAGQKITVNMVMGSEVTMQRQELVEQALDTDCTHLLWIDSDISFPTYTLNALLSHDKDIIACNYSTRVPPHRPVAFRSEYDLDSRVYDGTGIQKIWAVGMGCMLVKREVYENIPAPHFRISWDEVNDSLMGEDIYFCTKAREAGYDVWLENDLSKNIAHIGTKSYTIKGDCND